MKAAAASVFRNLKIDFFGVGHLFDMMLIIVLIRGECETVRGSVQFFVEFVDSPLFLGGNVEIDAVFGFG